MSCQIIYLAERRRSREACEAQASFTLLWPALITSCVLCWGLIGLTAIHFVPFISEALRTR